MLFSSMFFLWYFFPFVFILYRILDDKYKNIFLLVASLFFYAWGEPKYIILMLVSISMNYTFGILVDYLHGSNRKIALGVCVIANISLLGYFKYYNFFVSNINLVGGNELIQFRDIILPIGISFYTFQALSYVIDLYRNQIFVQKNIFNLALYISFFPQLIAGPIIKYKDIDDQIVNRHVSVQKTAYGVKRFVYGLSKKVILANTFAAVVDKIYALSVYELSTPLVWCAALLYSLQIYFDFSGYSDMAIGLGKMFGFDFMENFNYPYISKSIQDFWRRWHISLSTWFREYLYIPLGGNKKGSMRTYINLIIVFFATGLWHGASFNFIVWGLYNGVFLIVERLFLGKLLKRNNYKLINHIYVILVIIVGWVFFRANDLYHAIDLLKIMFIGNSSDIYALSEFLNVKIVILLLFGLVFCGPIQNYIPRLKTMLYYEQKAFVWEYVVQIQLMLICIMLLASSTYNPFIYFRF